MRLKELLNYTNFNKELKENYFVIKALEKDHEEDRNIKIISLETTELIVRLFQKKDKND